MEEEEGVEAGGWAEEGFEVDEGGAWEDAVFC